MKAPGRGRARARTLTCWSQSTPGGARLPPGGGGLRRDSPGAPHPEGRAGEGVHAGAKQPGRVRLGTGLPSVRPSSCPSVHADFYFPRSPWWWRLRCPPAPSRAPGGRTSWLRSRSWGGAPGVGAFSWPPLGFLVPSVASSQCSPAWPRMTTVGAAFRVAERPSP